MILRKEGQELTVATAFGEVVYFERYREGSKQLIRSWGTLFGNSFRWEGLHIKKYGRGKMKNEIEVHNELQKIDSFLRNEGFSINQL
jgi:hypothetical protein